ncbi:putative 2OG-Fe(II) oxygenase [Erythrobacter sp. THAF29]|uniref:2OG-Fe(II) oxygenase family protein n=1 Tax=Erythrobacter sp. THAF29 TaxID=2587851 RepID=UPI0012694DD9|nr:putative 2OG-Fe(II) oxygenase [Erythrobacter sp. THAF29]QFT78502.1 Anaphase-promoting complex, cyclosome, subunit 3 [Erythrobacter sp. THAF29]
MALNWKPYIYNAGGHRRALTSLFYAGISQGLDPRKLCEVGADITQLTSHDCKQARILADALTDYAPKDASVWYFRAQALRLGMEDAQALKACDQALAIDPDHVESLAMKGKLLIQLGELEQAERNLRKVAKRSLGMAVAPLCECLIRQGEVDRAGQLISDFSKTHPPSAGLSALECARCLLSGDTESLAQLQQPELISVVSGGPDLATLNHALISSLKNNAAMVEEPASTTTVNGRQAFLNDLLPKRILDEMIALIKQEVERYILEHSDHSYLADLPGELNLTAWAVALDDQGFQSSHCHPGGRLSGVYYVDAAKDLDRMDGSGALEFWRPPKELVGPVECETRLVQPQDGMLLIFPSYFYHRTIPHRGRDGRISIAFDVG